MTGYVARRLLALVPLLLIISIVVFSLTFLIPGDPARTIAGPHASAERVVAVRHQLGLDQSVLAQYWHWLTHALSGNLGSSLFTNTTVASEISHRFPVTFSLAIGALLLAIVLGVLIVALIILSYLQMKT